MMGKRIEIFVASFVILLFVGLIPVMADDLGSNISTKDVERVADADYQLHLDEAIFDETVGVGEQQEFGEGEAGVTQEVDGAVEGGASHGDAVADDGASHGDATMDDGSSYEDRTVEGWLVDEVAGKSKYDLYSQVDVDVDEAFMGTFQDFGLGASLLAPLGEDQAILSGADDNNARVSITNVFHNGIDFGGNNYRDLYISTNGYITFGHGNSGYSPLGITQYTRGPIIAAQFDDLDPWKGGTIYYDQNIAENYVVVTFENVRPFRNPIDGSDDSENTYQIVLRRIGEAGSKDFQIELRYHQLQWARSGNNSAWPTAGWSTGSLFQVSYAELFHSGQPTFRQIVTGSNIGEPGVYRWDVTSGLVQAPPTVNDTAVPSAITFNSALSGGNVSSDGALDVTSRGLAYGTSPFPTIDNRTVISGSGIGSFTATMTDLSPSTTYYVRAFATNALGTSYGPQRSFTTASLMEQTILFEALAPRTYGDDIFDLVATASSDLAVTFASSNPHVATVVGNTVTIVGAGSTTITASQLGNSYYSPAPSVSQVLTIHKKDLTIAANGVTKRYGDLHTFDGYEFRTEGLINDDSVGFVNFHSNGAAASAMVGDYDILISEAAGTGLENYAITYENGTLNVTKRELLVIANDAVKTVGSSDPVFTVRYVGLIASDTPSVIEGTLALVREEGESVGTYMITPSGITAANYIIQFETGTFTIRRRSSSSTGSSGSGGSGSGGSGNASGTLEPGAGFLPGVPGAALDPTTSDAVLFKSEISIVVNDKEQNAGTSTLIEVDGEKLVEIRTDSAVISRIIDEVSSSEKEATKGLQENKIVVPVAGTDAKHVKSILTGDIVKKMEQNEFSLVIDTGEVAYILPARDIAIEEIASLLQVGADSLAEIDIEVDIVKVDGENAQEIAAQAMAKNYEVLVPPVEFQVVAKAMTPSGESKVAISTFNRYVSRVVAIPAEVDRNKITTGIVYNPFDGTFAHIPTEVFVEDGKWYAKLNSLTNSSYSVIWNPITVASVENHWSQNAVNDMASRLIINNPDAFRPDASITRGDFAEYITKALGIYRTNVSKAYFTDVDLAHAYGDAITVAVDYGLIQGYPDGTFRPDETITREEAMTLYARAMDRAGLEEVDRSRIENYVDKDQIATWAYESVKKTVGAGVFQGKTLERLDPKDTFTYAEAAQAIRNLLIQARLIS
ncbi:S-layer homology domain-containing protein [Heliorestis convoluta]|uniref:Cell Wall Surface protein, putative n=1 Tax=Heliorestis convoluta TaxID=356322 RepID=A0A5Q2N4N7_9FIRM|nr:MBG domain-containing protein [Heliorestis convoluta]QGG47220.1 Cell Wall Surface protein, putative [Heliorestis convoluta]